MERMGQSISSSTVDWSSQWRGMASYARTSASTCCYSIRLPMMSCVSEKIDKFEAGYLSRAWIERLFRRKPPSSLFTDWVLEVMDAVSYSHGIVSLTGLSKVSYWTVCLSGELSDLINCIDEFPLISTI